MNYRWISAKSKVHQSRKPLTSSYRRCRRAARGASRRLDRRTLGGLDRWLRGGALRRPLGRIKRGRTRWGRRRHKVLDAAVLEGAACAILKAEATEHGTPPAALAVARLGARAHPIAAQSAPASLRSSSPVRACRGWIWVPGILTPAHTAARGILSLY